MPLTATGLKRKPRLLFAVASSPNRIGGIEAFASELARQLKERGWDLIMCFEDFPPPLVEAFLLASGNVQLVVIRNQESMRIASALSFLPLLRKYKPNVLLYSLGGAVRWWPLLARLTGVQRAVYWDQTSRTAATINYRAKFKVKLLMKSLSQSVCATKFVKACSDREGIVPSNRSVVIYNSVDNERGLGDAAAFRGRYGVPAGRLIVTQVSWLVPEKGIDLALRAAKRALSVRDDLQFVFCGEGDHRPSYEKLATELGIADHITWTGEIEDIAASGAFRAADIQIQCSQWHEAFCLAVAEGMSADLPVAASRIGGLPELIEDSVNGYLFDPSSEEQLASAILTLAANKDLRSRMGQEGRKRALENYDLVRNVNRWIKVLLA